MRTASRPLLITTGIALLVLPLFALGLKSFSFGWMMVILMFGPILLLLIGYALQVVIAVQGFFLPRGAFAVARGRQRGVLAAWLSGVGLMLVAIFMPDGGDTGYGSTLQVWLGAYTLEDPTAMHEATDTLTGLLAMVAAVVWVGAYLWLFVEWIIALSQRRRAVM